MRLFKSKIRVPPLTLKVFSNVCVKLVIDDVNIPNSSYKCEAYPRVVAIPPLDDIILFSSIVIFSPACNSTCFLFQFI